MYHLMSRRPAALMCSTPTGCLSTCKVRKALQRNLTAESGRDVAKLDLEVARDQVGIADIALHKAVARVPLHIGQVARVARIGEQVQIDQGLVTTLEPPQHEGRADESAAAGNQYHAQSLSGKTIILGEQGSRLGPDHRLHRQPRS